MSSIALHYDIGEVHNEMMEAAKIYENFNFTTENSTIVSLTAFQKNFYTQIDSSIANREFIDESTLSIDPRILKSRIVETEKFLDTLKNKFVITEEEYTILSEIKSLISENCLEIISNEEFYSQILSIYQNTPNLENMKLAPSVLQLTIASCEYWIDKGNLGTSGEKFQTLAIPAWVAADGAGALWAAAVSALKQYNATGDVSLKKTATDALIGAAASSLGLVSKIGRAISNLFK